MKKLLILGASGLVGKALIEECKDVFDLYGTYFSSPPKLPQDKQFQLDIQDNAKMRGIISSIKPDIVISCLRGDFNRQVEFHQQLALELQNNKSIVYYFSTANVFDGDYSMHHTETDRPVSVSDYGNFKINCENALKQILAERVIIIRIPQIWGVNSLRLNTIKESINNNAVIDVYCNLECNNLLDTQLAKQMRFILEKELKGIFHLGTVDMMTQSEFVERIVRKITDTKIKFQYNHFHEKGETYYFGIKSSRIDIPDFLLNTNKDMISNLVGRN